MQRSPGDEIRGVIGHHIRVPITCDKELDRLHMEQGVQAPWMDTSHDFTPDEFYNVVEFLTALIRIGDHRRKIFFARLEGLTWEQIGSALLGGKTPQAAENAFAKILRDFGDLARAFPERGRNGAQTTQTRSRCHG